MPNMRKLEYKYRAIVRPIGEFEGSRVRSKTKRENVNEY